MIKLLDKFCSWWIRVRFYNEKAPAIIAPFIQSHSAYDPHQDENKIMSGEVESYFD